MRRYFVFSNDVKAHVTVTVDTWAYPRPTSKHIMTTNPTMQPQVASLPLPLYNIKKVVITTYLKFIVKFVSI